MLYYLEITLAQIAAAFAVTGFVLGWAKSGFEKIGVRSVWAGILAGIIFACILSSFKNMTSRVDTRLWNFRIFFVLSLSIVLFIVFNLLKLKVQLIFISIFTAMTVLLSLHEVFAFPGVAFIAEQRTFSTGFIYKLFGILFAFIISFILFYCTAKNTFFLNPKIQKCILYIILILTLLWRILGLVYTAITKLWIKATHTLFLFSKFYANQKNLFLYACLLLCLTVSVILTVKSFNVKEPYKNPAQHRKIRAKWLHIKRRSASCFICFILVVLTLTAGHAFNNRKIEIAPVEDSIQKDGNVYVSTEQVSDGHLHRFAITSPNGIEIRFIVIQKTNGKAFGVGMDACEICGETGYYEKDGQIVCKLCDVVMNVNTIGFPGGCNPMIVDYRVKDGFIIVPVEGLLFYEKEFK